MSESIDRRRLEPTGKGPAHKYFRVNCSEIRLANLLQIQKQLQCSYPGRQQNSISLPSQNEGYKKSNFMSVSKGNLEVLPLQGDHVNKRIPRKENIVADWESRNIQYRKKWKLNPVVFQ